MVKSLIAALLVASVARAETIRDVRVFDGTKVIPNATVTFENGVITSVEPAVAAKPVQQTLLPGLIDSHTHVFPGSLARALRFGVTTELDMFTNLETLRQFHKTANDRADLRSAGILVTVAGGHGSEYFPIPLYQHGADPQAFIDTRIAEGSDYIKFVYDDGSAFGLKWNTLAKEDLKALVAAAHKRHKIAVVHISTLRGARDVIEAGADGIVHLFGDTPPDAAFGKFVAQHHAFVTPTLTVIESVSGTGSGSSLVTDLRLRPYLSADEAQNLKTAFPSRPANVVRLANAFEAVKQLRAAGAPILAGTDAPNPGTAHGASMHRELELLVKAGLTPIEALKAATSVPAATFGLEDRGRIAKGMRADLLLVNGDPTTDILATRDIARVWKSGAPVARQPEEKQTEGTGETIAADKLSSGMISDFEDGQTDSRIGVGWQISTDSIAGGKSTAKMNIIDGGAAGTAKSLRVETQTAEGSMFPWAGAMVFFGSRPMTAVNLSSKSGIRFYAKGDADIRLMLFTKSSGRIPRMTTVHAGADWTDLSATWSTFAVDGKDIQAILFSGPLRNATFEIDEVRLQP